MILYMQVHSPHGTLPVRLKKARSEGTAESRKGVHVSSKKGVVNGEVVYGDTSHLYGRSSLLYRYQTLKLTTATTTQASVKNAKQQHRRTNNELKRATTPKKKHAQRHRIIEHTRYQDKDVHTSRRYPNRKH